MHFALHFAPFCLAFCCILPCVLLHFTLRFAANSVVVFCQTQPFFFQKARIFPQKRSFALYNFALFASNKTLARIEYLQLVWLLVHFNATF